jgi:drug/metabolite transporter (DMT)-like permease
LQHYSAKKVSMVISLQVVYAALIAYLLLSETLSWGTVIGGTCILCAALGESLRKKT